MENPSSLLIFGLDHQRYALPLAQVEHVIAAVAVTVLPHAPSVVLGVFSFHGRVIPVMNTRRRFSLPERPLEIDDQFILARAGDRTVALVVDHVEGVIEAGEAARIAPKSLLPDLRHIEGVLCRPDGLVLVHDLGTFLGLDEAQSLEAALAGTPGGAP